MGFEPVIDQDLPTLHNAPYSPLTVESVFQVVAVLGKKPNGRPVARLATAPSSCRGSDVLAQVSAVGHRSCPRLAAAGTSNPGNPSTARFCPISAGREGCFTTMVQPRYRRIVQVVDTKTSGSEKERAGSVRMLSPLGEP